MSRAASKESVSNFTLVSKEQLQLRLGSKESVSAGELRRPSKEFAYAPVNHSTPVGGAYSVARSRSKTQLRAALSTYDETAKMRRLANALKPFKEFKENPSLLGKDGLDADRLLREQERRLSNPYFDKWETMVQFQEILSPLHAGTAVSQDTQGKDEKKLAVFQKGRKSLLSGLKDGSLEKVVNEMEEQKRIIAAELGGLENMELSIPDFIKCFRKNDNLVDKVAFSTGISSELLKSFKDEDLKTWFINMDTDKSGTLSFDEFVEGIVKIREAQAAAQVADEANQAKKAVFQKGRRNLVAGLKDGSLERVVQEMEEKKAMIATELEGYEKMNLSTDEFIKTFQTDEKLLRKVALTAQVPVEALKSIKEADLRTWFKDMDQDGDNMLSFDEFIEGIVKMQEEIKANDTKSAKIAIFQKGRNSLIAGLKDGSLEKVVNEMEEQKRLIAAELEDLNIQSMELSIPDFINMFRTNEKLLNKVALATDMSKEDLKNIDDNDMNKWFVEMDTDNSGTLSFDEFVDGIATIREKLRKGEKLALFAKGRKSLIAGLRDGSLERVVQEMEEKKRQVAEELGESFEELETDKFIEKFRSDKKLVAKVAEQTGIDLDILNGLDDAKLKVWFKQMDEAGDNNGKLSFDEFVEGIVTIREEQKKDETKTAKLALFQKGRKSLISGLKDGTLEKVVAEMEEKKAMVAKQFEGFEKMELTIPEFIKVFRKNQNLVMKVSVATGMHVEDLNALNDETMQEWFTEMDADKSGTLSFDEFVEGIVKIREDQLATEGKDEAVKLITQPN